MEFLLLKTYGDSIQPGRLILVGSYRPINLLAYLMRAVGGGGFVCFLHDNGYQNAEGVDISKENVAAAKRLGIQNSQQGDLKEYLEKCEGVYEVIFMRDVLEHFFKDEIVKVLSLAYKALKAGGVLVIQTVNGESPFSGRYRWWDFTHEMAFTHTSLRQLLACVGFKEFCCFEMGPVCKGLKSCLRRILWIGIRSFLKFYLLVETGQSNGIFTQNLIGTAQK